MSKYDYDKYKLSEPLELNILNWHCEDKDYSSFVISKDCFKLTTQSN